MSDTNTWPDAERPGVPLNPEQDGWHWISIDGREPECKEWLSYRKHIRMGEGRNGTWWIVGTAVACSPASASKWRYFGQALTPDEVSAQIKAFAGEMRANVDAARAALAEMKAAIAFDIAEARRAALEEAARVVEGKTYNEHYRTWPWWREKSGVRYSPNNDLVVKHCDKITAAIRALAKEPGNE
jgi:hypothetical protein